MSIKKALNPLVPSAANMRRNAKILILILEGIIKKISYDYESVDEKKTYLCLCPEKLRKKKNSGSKGLKSLFQSHATQS